MSESDRPYRGMIEEQYMQDFRPWLWKVPADAKAIGKRAIRRKDGYEKASGKAVYARDIYRPGMLYAKLFLSPYCHAKIKSMDTKAAEAYPGVRAVLRYDDPNIKWPSDDSTPASLLGNEAHWYGQPVGALVVAESEPICDRALRLIKIDWEELPFILDAEEALKPGAPLLRPDRNPKDNLKSQSVKEYGDVEKGFGEAEVIAEFKYVNPDEDVWAGVAGLVAIAEWKGDYLEVWPASQMPDYAREVLLAHTAGGKMIVNNCYLPAQFGGINWVGQFPALLCHFAAFAAKRTQKPVKVVYDESEFHGTEHRWGTYYYKVGFKKDGTITAVKLDTVLGTSSLGKLREGTKIPNMRLSKKDPYVSRAPQVCYRDGSSMANIVRMVWEHVAGELGMDPTKVAEINDGCDGEDMAWINENVKKVQGFDPTRDSLKECHAVGKAAIDWDNKWHLPGTKLLASGKYHGIGYTSVIQWETFRLDIQQSTGIRVQSDGSVRIIGQHADGGWCGETTYCQVVADEMGMKYEDVSHRPFGDVGGFITRSGGGSRGLIANLGPLIRAAQKTKELLLQYAVLPSPSPIRDGIIKTIPALFPDKKAEELDLKDSVIFEKAKPENKKTVGDLAKRFLFRESGPLFAWTYASTILEEKYVMARQAHFLEVEVDPETGAVEVKRSVDVNDVGTAVNPDSVNGQQYGGTYMGVGRSFTEAVYSDPQTGVKLNDNLIGYAISLMNDISGPVDCHIVETGLGYAPYGTYGCSESGGAVGCTLGASAVYHAIGKYIDDFPVTPDKVLKALGKI